ncbi:hypothetical protein [Bradyrhizobium liaoningense]|uniref:hypothetical protein n=1 Tax=Bradyrhizobium liaoningense TaxID=43992 RepID=UPI001BA5F1EA|nr:hypothetical protein [Bradyrhizobium liaoningense]MBR0907109.1 hypothetical protein [Bradyrhizobium liaoningense]
MNRSIFASSIIERDFFSRLSQQKNTKPEKQKWQGGEQNIASATELRRDDCGSDDDYSSEYVWKLVWAPR